MTTTADTRREDGTAMSPARAAGGQPSRGAMVRFAVETRGQTVRWLIQLKREPFSLLFALFQPLIILVFLGGSFQKLGGVVTQGSDYRTFMLPGILALTIFGNSMAGGIPVLFDKETGFLSRLIAAPVTRLSIFFSRFITVNIVTTVQCLVVLALCAPFGIHVVTGVAGIAGILGLGLLLGFGVTVISLILAFVLHGHGGFFALMGMITLPVTFLSTAFVPLDAMPRWMQIVAVANPMTYAIDAMRGLVLGGLGWPVVLRSFVALGIFDAVMLVVGTWFLRRRVV